MEQRFSESSGTGHVGAAGDDLVKSAEFRELKLDELLAKSQELRSELFNVKIRKATGQLENTARLRLLRREIARAETILREKRGATT